MNIARSNFRELQAFQFKKIDEEPQTKGEAANDNSPKKDDNDKQAHNPSLYLDRKILEDYMKQLAEMDTTNISGKTNSANSDSIVEVDGVKVDCSGLSSDGYIRGAGISASANAVKMLQDLKEQLKAQYGDKLNGIDFEDIYNQAIQDTISHIKWTQDKLNTPAKAEVKVVVSDFIKILNKAVSEAQKSETPSTLSQPQEFVVTEDVMRLYNDFTSLSVSNFTDLYNEVMNAGNNAKQLEIIQKFIDQYNIEDKDAQEILADFNEMKGRIKGGAFSSVQIKLLLIKDYAEPIIKNKQEQVVSKFLNDNHITSITPEELVKKLNDIKEIISKCGGMSATQVHLIALADLQKILNEAALKDIPSFIDKNIDKTYDVFNQNNDKDETLEFEKIYDDLIPRKEELKAFVGQILDNDIYAETTLDIFTAREVDTFIDSVITEVVHNANGETDINKLMDAIKAKIQKRLAVDPLDLMDITANLQKTDDYLLSDEEKAIKTDLTDIEFDKDPEKIDGSGFDYSVMSDSGKSVASMTADWDYMDIDTALNSKNMYGEYSDKTGTAKLYQNLEQLKPQLKSYIKEQLEANGLKYNEETVEKYLNYYITEVVREAIQAKYHDQLPELYPDTVLGSEATLEDLGELLATKVKDELAEGADAFGTNWQSKDVDPLLCGTSDYFLTFEEKLQKQQMERIKSGL